MSVAEVLSEFKEKTALCGSMFCCTLHRNKAKTFFFCVPNLLFQLSTFLCFAGIRGRMKSQRGRGGMRGGRRGKGRGRGGRLGGGKVGDDDGDGYGDEIEVR